jgi:peptidoglycan/xylan/chitin deacetylase (PgdA/CDA1 family)
MSKIVKTIARKIVFPIICNLKLEKLLFGGSSNNFMILMYHGINKSPQLRYNGRHLSEKTFEKHLKYLNKHFNVVSLEELFRLQKEGTTPTKKTIAITFDDGFENNYLYAFPLLKKYKVPATFFVSSICITDENPVLWPDFIDILREHIELPLVYNDYSFVPNPNNPKKLYDPKKDVQLGEFIKGMSTAERTTFLKETADKYLLLDILQKIDPDLWKLMNAAQVKEMADANIIEIASHAHSHYNLANIEHEAAEHEIKSSKELLEKVTGKTVKSIAYPDGSYNEYIKEISLKNGYTNLCAVTYKLKNDSSDANILPRSAVSATTTYYSNIIHFHKNFKNEGF